MPRRQAPRREGSDEEMEAPGVEPPQDESENESEEVETEKFDPKTFEHAVIPAAAHTKIKAITDSWDIPKDPLQYLIKIITESATGLAQAGQAKDPKIMNDLDQAMREVADVEAHIAARKDAAMSIRQDLTQAAHIREPATAWREKFMASLEDYNKKTSRQKYANNKTYSEYRQELWRLEEKKPMRSLKSLIPKEEGDESDDDDEIEVGGKTVSYLDPLTRVWLENPVTSRTCGHSYSHSSIYEFLGRGSKKCPEAGCDKYISRVDLEENETLAREVRNAQRQEAERRIIGVATKESVYVDSSEDEIIE